MWTRSVIFKQLAKENNHPLGENSPYLVTLINSYQLMVIIGCANKLNLWCLPGLPDFSLYSIPKQGKIYQITIKYPKWPQNLPNGCKTANIPISSIARHTKIYPNLTFWFENMTSGNPGAYLLRLKDYTLPRKSR
jgi:hypothetical protein